MSKRPEYVTDLGLSKRAENGLVNANLVTVSQLLERKYAGLKRYRQMGPKAIIEIRERLQASGIKLDAGWKVPGSDWESDIK